jgi:hypothetical protein
MMGNAESSKMADCLHVGAKTESKVKSLTAGMFDFSGLGFLTSILLSA